MTPPTYPGAMVITNSSVFGPGFGVEIYLDNLRCTGTEEELLECPRAPAGEHNCQHVEDIGVICPIPGSLAFKPF